MSPHVNCKTSYDNSHSPRKVYRGGTNEIKLNLSAHTENNKNKFNAKEIFEM
jgi:hypothetical protein